MSAGTDTALGLADTRSPVARVARFVIGLVLVVVFAGPLLAMTVTAFSDGAGSLTLWPVKLGLENFRIAIDLDVLRYLGNSFIVVGGALLLQVAVSVFAGYALARKKFRGAAFVMVAVLATMMLPEEVLAIPLSLVLADVPVIHVNLIGSLAGVIFPLGAWGFSILVMTEFMREVPVELEEAARLDGAGEWTVFSKIILPLCKPALGVIGVFGFTMIWDQHLLPLIVSDDASTYTLPIALRSLRTDPDVTIGVLMASSLLALLPSVLVFLFFQRSFARGLTAGALKG